MTRSGPNRLGGREARTVEMEVRGIAGDGVGRKLTRKRGCELVGESRGRIAVTEWSQTAANPHILHLCTNTTQTCHAVCVTAFIVIVIALSS